MDGRRDGRRSSDRPRIRELAAIAGALLVVPLAALAGLLLPIDPSGPLAPNFAPPHSPAAHVRSATAAVAQLTRAPVPTPDPPPRRAAERELAARPAAPVRPARPARAGAAASPSGRDHGDRHDRDRAAP